MATKRGKATWVAPRSGGYSASKSAATGRFVGSNGTGAKSAKPNPPGGRASAAVSKEKSA
jgi:hypothetical protein